MNKDLKIPVIIVLVIAIISLGVAFAAFNSSLTINGNSTIDASTWDIVFEGLDSEHPTVLGSPTIPQGSTASVLSAPTINNNQTDISSFSVSLSTPGDSITYNFKVHNRGTVAARVTNLDIQEGIYLTTNTSRRTSDADTLNNIEYKLYYTESNLAMGSDNDRDCLSPGESELVSLRIVFLASNDESVLPSTDLVLDNLGVTVTYTSETSCSSSAGGGGNSGGGNNPSPTITVGTPTTDGSNEASPVTNPTVSNNTITGAEVNIPNPGDEVDFPITITSNDGGGISGVILPTMEEILAANPDIDPSILQNIGIALLDSNGNEVDANTNRPCLDNMMTNLTLAIRNNQPQNSQILTNMAIAIPTTTLTFSNDCDPVVEYLYSSIRNSITKEYDYTFTDDKTDLQEMQYDNHVASVYIKKTNGVPEICLYKNSDEHCLGEDTTRSTISQFCAANIAPATFGYGSWLGEEYGLQCDNENYYYYNEFDIILPYVTLMYTDSIYMLNSPYIKSISINDSYYNDAENSIYHNNNCLLDFASDGSYFIYCNYN